jgi:hypothetical protein
MSAVMYPCFGTMLSSCCVMLKSGQHEQRAYSGYIYWVEELVLQNCPHGSGQSCIGFRGPNPRFAAQVFVFQHFIEPALELKRDCVAPVALHSRFRSCDESAVDGVCHCDNMQACSVCTTIEL